MLWTTFPSEFDTNALQLLYQAWLGQPVDKNEAVLAALNIAGYAWSKLEVPATPQMAAAIDKAKIDAAFKAAIASKGDAKAATAIPWATIFAAILALLQQWLPH